MRRPAMKFDASIKLPNINNQDATGRRLRSCSPISSESSNSTASGFEDHVGRVMNFCSRQLPKISGEWPNLSSDRPKSSLLERNWGQISQ